MATTITSLAIDIAAGDSVNAAKLALAPLAKFSKSFTAAQGEKGNVVKVPVFANMTAEEFGPNNNYTSATDAGVEGKNVELNSHPWASKRLLPDDAMETDAGKDWTKQVTVNSVKAVAKSVTAKALVAAAKSGTGALTLTGTTALDKVAKCRAETIAAGINPADATLLLPSDLYTELLKALPVTTIGINEAILNGNVERLFGFGYIAELMDEVSYTNSSSKKVTVNAMVIANDALGVAMRLPIVQNADKFDVSDLVDEETGVAIRLRATGTNDVDAKFLGAEVIAGCEVLKPAEILIKATTAA